MSFQLKLVSPNNNLTFADCLSLKVQTNSGEILILPNHENLVTTLKIGILQINSIPTTDSFFVFGGCLSIEKNIVMISTADFISKKMISEDFIDFLEQKKVKIRQLISTATAEQGSFNPSFDLKYLLAEERLAKFEFFKQLKS
jgi:F0F1-type ATP synthase epsilon subunit